MKHFSPSSPASNFYERIIFGCLNRIPLGFYTGLLISIGLAASSLIAVQTCANEMAIPPPKSNAGRPQLLDPEMQKAIIDSLPRPSMDTTPVVITSRGKSYRIPRNYLWNLGSIPEIRVTAPGFPIAGFQPLTEATRACFGSLQQGWNAGCQAIDFLLEPGGVQPVEKQMSYVRTRDNALPKNGPFGYEFYDYERGNATDDELVEWSKRRTFHVTYTKIHNGRRVLFECTVIFKKINNKLYQEIIACYDKFELLDGNGE